MPPNTSTLPAGQALGAVPPACVPRALWVAVAAVALTAAGIASALAWRGQAADVPPLAPAGAVAAAPPARGAPPQGQHVPAAALSEPAAVPSGTAREATPVIDEPAERPASPARGGTRTAAARGHTAPEAPVRPAAVCARCGTVESVQAVKQAGEGSGVGAVAGGVLGGVVGNQIGGGNGRKAMTVLGAIGGGVAGHQIEKSVRSTTVYNVRVRMDDGTLRTVTQSQAPVVGSRVKLEGGTLRAA